MGLREKPYLALMQIAVDVFHVRDDQSLAANVVRVNVLDVLRPDTNLDSILLSRGLHHVLLGHADTFGTKRLGRKR